VDVIPPNSDGLTTITEAMLTVTTVPETAPAAYSSGTTYALGAQASDLSANLILVYVSLQAANTGNTPATSPLWWRLIGRTYPVYSSGHTYALGDRAIDAVNHLEYSSLTASNTGNPLTDDTHWVQNGPTNRWASLDLNRSTGTTSPSPMTYAIAPGKRVDSVGLAGMVADSYTISITKDGAPITTDVYPYTENLSTRVVLGWRDWLTKPFTFRAASARFDLPLISGAVITITLTRASGDVTLGALFVNRGVDLGDTETDPQDDAENFSTFDRDIEGTATDFIPRRLLPLVTLGSLADAERTPEIRDTRDALRATPAFWCGIRDVTDPYFESMVTVGVWKSFKITPGYGGARCDITLEEA
jgi:hypothetical protein